MPSSVISTDFDAKASLVCSGPELAVDPSKPASFFTFLEQWGGEWMWSDITNEGSHMKWVVDAIKNGAAIWVPDCSYNCTLAPYISGAGWLVYCTACKRKLCGSFSEYSHKAGLYRGELLGLLVIHTLLTVLEEYYQIPPSSGKICCDNEGALYKTKEFRCRIPVGASQADIKRALDTQRQMRVENEADL